MSKPVLFQNHTEENSRIWGVLGGYFSLQGIENTAQQWVFQEKLNFEGLQYYIKDIRIFVEEVLKSFSDR